MPQKEPFAFAGLWDTWTGADGTILDNCTILTTAASESVRDIHHRMPIILTPDAYAPWLNPEIQDTAELEEILKEKTVIDFAAHPVSKYVNSPKNNDPKCIDPKAAESW